jgi:hypothetical protein
LRLQSACCWIAWIGDRKAIHGSGQSWGRKDPHGKEVIPGESTEYYTAGGPSRTSLTAGRNYVHVKESML